MKEELRIAICDDEEYYRNYIGGLIREYLKGDNVSLKIDLYEDGNQFCAEAENYQKYDIVFLDIEMEKMNGMETAYALRKRNRSVEIVFITVVMEYVFEGYQVDALRYIMKRDLEQLLPECLDTLLKKRIFHNQKMKFPFIGGTRSILLRDLLYIESTLHRLCFNMKQEQLFIYDKLDSMEKVLSEYGFVRTHQSFLVNIKYIERIQSYTVYLMDGTEIPVTKPRYQDVKEQFLRYKEL